MEGHTLMNGPTITHLGTDRADAQAGPIAFESEEAAVAWASASTSRRVLWPVVTLDLGEPVVADVSPRLVAAPTDPAPGTATVAPDALPPA